MYRVYVGLGSNIGDKLAVLQGAVELLRQIGRVVAISSVYETEPVGMDAAKSFYNMAIALETELDPTNLMKKLKELEGRLGRANDTHLKDREIDLDILLYEGLYYEDDELQVPHAALGSRLFALVPLHEIAPAVIHPLLGLSVAELKKQCSEKARVEQTSHRIS